jgi:hypothetical protein
VVVIIGKAAKYSWGGKKVQDGHSDHEEQSGKKAQVEPGDRGEGPSSKVTLEDANDETLSEEDAIAEKRKGKAVKRKRQ